jgi:hypothetical protein
LDLFTLQSFLSRGLDNLISKHLVDYLYQSINDTSIMLLHWYLECSPLVISYFPECSLKQSELDHVVLFIDSGFLCIIRKLGLIFEVASNGYYTGHFVLAPLFHVHKTQTVILYSYCGWDIV